MILLILWEFVWFKFLCFKYIFVLLRYFVKCLVKYKLEGLLVYVLSKFLNFLINVGLFLNLLYVFFIFLIVVSKYGGKYVLLNCLNFIFFFF